MAGNKYASVRSIVVSVSSEAEGGMREGNASQKQKSRRVCAGVGGCFENRHRSRASQRSSTALTGGAAHVI